MEHPAWPVSRVVVQCIISNTMASAGGRWAQFAVAEGLVWRCMDMAQRLDRGALSAGRGQPHVAAATDAPIHISLVSLADLSAAVRRVPVPPSKSMHTWLSV